MSTCEKSSSCNESNYPENIIETNKEVDCPRDAKRPKLSPYERYCLLKIGNHYELKMHGLDDGNMLQKTRFGKKRGKMELENGV